MPCPDRKNDERIIAEIERRKAMQQKSTNLALNDFEVIFVEGTLQDVIQYRFPEKRILKIQKQGDGWEVFLKNNEQ